MNGHEIEVALRGERLCRDEFVGVFAADTIPHKEYPGAYIVNTDRSGEPGQHWVAFYCERPGILEAFDSSDDFLVISSCVLQSENSTLCGNYCLYFLLLRCHGFSYDDLLSIFCRDRTLSDLYVCKFINKYFKLRKKIQDTTVILNTLLKK